MSGRTGDAVFMLLDVRPGRRRGKGRWVQGERSYYTTGKADDPAKLNEVGYIYIGYILY